MKWLQRAISIGKVAPRWRRVYAATITVNNTGDGSVAGQCTTATRLTRQHQRSRVRMRGGQRARTIVFSLRNSVIMMGNNSFDYWITESLTIDGAGAQDW